MSSVQQFRSPSSPRFTYRTVQVVIPAATPTVGTLIFPASPIRASLVVSSNAVSGAGGTTNVQIGTRSRADSRFLVLVPPIAVTLPYRDYGSIIRDAIYGFTVSAVDVTLYVTEIYQLPN